jgi:hypothetical protein
MEETTRQATVLYGNLLSENDFGKIIRDKDSFRTAMPLEKFLETAVGASRESTINCLDAATILFAHSMVDGAAFDYCRVTVLHAPADWESDILNKRVPLETVRDELYEKIRQMKIDAALEDLEMESLRKKIDRLHARCKPEQGWSPMTGYEFNLERIEQLDRLRQDIVHGDALGRPINAVEDELDYMNRTCMYFLGLVNLRYGLKIDPQFVMTFMSKR